MAPGVLEHVCTPFYSGTVGPDGWIDVATSIAVWMTEDSCFEFLPRNVFSKAPSTLDLGLNRPPILRLPGATFPELQRPWREAGQLTLSSAAITSNFPRLHVVFWDTFFFLVFRSTVMLSVQIVRVLWRVCCQEQVETWCHNPGCKCLNSCCCTTLRRNVYQIQSAV